MRYFILILFIVTSFGSKSQVVTISPTDATINDQITLTFDVAQATDSRAEGLLGLSDGVYLWSGAGDNSNAFIYGPDGQSDFSQPVPGGEMTALGDDIWEITITPKNYFGIPDGVEITQLGLLLKNTDGTSQTEDLFVEIGAGDFITFTSPADYGNTNFVGQDEIVSISAESSDVGDLELLIDEGAGFTPVASSVSSSSITYNYQVSADINLKVKVIAELPSGTVERIDSIEFFIESATVEEPLPIGVIEGINYDQADNTKVTLVLKAPLKNSVYVVGDFTNWELDNAYQMKRDTDGETYWIEITGLTAGQEFIFQYWVDGTIKVGDPYADKVADPWNDQFISESVYPGLIEYSKTEHGIASVLQTGQTPFNWDVSEDSWQRPEKENLVIYELLIRDFLGSHSYNDLTDTLTYLKKLGVNAIELMPVMEFDGNESWGYNPAYFLAPDKYYGTKEALKNFIQTAHQEGFAVILDMVLNHATGSNPYAAMYWDSQNNQPAADNPWFNQTARHEFNVFNDFDHESLYTQALVDTVNTYWLREYHFDGFRFDLSKGFTQNNTIGDVGAWGQYDQSRIDLLNRMATKIWDVDPAAYIILEHFAANDEETVLANQGMLLWGNLNHTFSAALTGEDSESNIDANNLTHVSYMESHDEERLVFENLENGQQIGGYNAADLSVALDRVKLATAFFYTLPGPKMMWQFQELGYDLSINTCSDGVTIDNNCRVSNKPLPWGDGNLGYYEDAERQKLYNTHRAIIGLTNEFSEVFDEGAVTTSLSASTKRINIEHAAMDVAIIGNFDLLSENINPNFSQTGKWYDYLSGDSIEVEDTNGSVNLLPGEFHIYTTNKLTTPEGETYSPPVAPTIESIENQTTNANQPLELLEVNLVAGTSPLENVTITATSSNQELISNGSIEVSGSGATRFLSFTPSNQVGVTTITVRASDGIISSSITFDLEVLEVVTSLNDKADSQNLKAYPNPASNIINVNFSNQTEVTVNLIDYTGKSYPAIIISESENTLQIDSSKLKQGLYMIELFTNNLKSYHRILITR